MRTNEHGGYRRKKKAGASRQQLQYWSKQSPSCQNCSRNHSQGLNCCSRIQLRPIFHRSHRSQTQCGFKQNSWNQMNQRQRLRAWSGTSRDNARLRQGILYHILRQTYLRPSMNEFDIIVTTTTPNPIPGSHSTSTRNHGGCRWWNQRFGTIKMGLVSSQGMS